MNLRARINMYQPIDKEDKERWEGASDEQKSQFIESMQQQLEAIIAPEVQKDEGGHYKVHVWMER